ncbi:MAG: VWA domain-containing protein [Candidatus Thermoplasmatota archaeon]|nr:VWA domain-containing protein [Candidatus Thermoplasmatota archaeon]
MKKLNSNYAVSPIIGTVLLLIIAVGAMSVVYLNVLSDEGPPNQKFVTVVGTVEGTDMIIEHKGGQPLEIEDIKLNIFFMNRTVSVNLEKDLSAEARADGYWSLGERISIPFPLENISYHDYDNIEAEVIAVDEQENSITFIGNLDLDVVSDVDVKVSVNDSSPEINQKIRFTVSVSNPEGIVDAKNVSIHFSLPDSFDYIDYDAEKGSYNKNSGIWKIGDLYLNQDAVNLEVTASFNGGDATFEFTQLSILVDGSGSVRGPDWNIMREGLSAAIKDPNVFPHTGSVELSIIQFAQNGAYLEIGPIVIDSSTYNSVASKVENLGQRNGGTPLACGLKLAADTFYNSPLFDEEHRQVVNIVTDGMPNRDCSDEAGVYTGSNVDYDEGKASAEEWREYLRGKCSFTEEKDEIDSLAVGKLSNYYSSGPDSEWLNFSIIWPFPGCIAPPFDAGRSWVREVDNWDDFVEASREMFRIIFQGIWVTSEIETSYPRDPNSTNDKTQLLIVPEPP